jgi:hypothetical protein
VHVFTYGVVEQITAGVVNLTAGADRGSFVAMNWDGVGAYDAARVSAQDVRQVEAYEHSVVDVHNCWSVQALGQSAVTANNCRRKQFSPGATLKLVPSDQ